MPSRSPTGSASPITSSTMKAASAPASSTGSSTNMRRAGRPIPCSLCNQGVKFTDLIAFASELGADCLATGHYVRRVSNGGRAELHKGADPRRDQSYFLYGTTSEQLDFLRFPLGDLPKSEVRRSRRGRPCRGVQARQPGHLLRPRRRLCVAGEAPSPGNRSAGRHRRPRWASAGQAPRGGPFHHRPAARDRDRRKPRATLCRSHRARGRGSSSDREARSRSQRCGSRS